MTYQVFSLLGIHSSGPNHKNLGPCLDTIKAAGRMMAVVDCHDDYGAGFEANQKWPGEVLTIGDIESFKDSFDIQLLREKARLNPHIRYWQVYNERNGDWASQTDSLISIMNEFGREFKFVIYNCSDGTPQYPEIDPVPYAQVARACAVAKAGGHMMAVHEYGPMEIIDPVTGKLKPNADHIFRYRKLADYLRARDALCDMVVTEAGPDEGRYVGDARFMEWCKAYDAGLMQDREYMRGAALWDTGGGGWSRVNFQSAFPALGQYIATVQPPVPPPPNPVVGFVGTCQESKWNAVRDAATAAGATIVRT